MKSFRELLEKDKTQNSNWRLAEEKCPHECRDEFKLIFLRCEVFRVKLAVKRYIKYWDNRLEVFGPDKAFLPILDLGPNGPLRDNRKELQCGYVQNLPADRCQDPDGRLISFTDATKLDEMANDPDITVEGILRAQWYYLHAGLLSSESAQRRGFVVLYRPPTSVKAVIKSPAKRMSASVRGAVPMRLAAVHIIDPPSFLFVLLKVARGLGRMIRERIHIHNEGSPEKNLESLSKYGIGREQVPKELGGDFVLEQTNVNDNWQASSVEC